MHSDHIKDILFCNIIINREFLNRGSFGFRGSLKNKKQIKCNYIHFPIDCCL